VEITFRKAVRSGSPAALVQIKTINYFPPSDKEEGDGHSVKIL